MFEEVTTEGGPKELEQLGEVVLRMLGDNGRRVAVLREEQSYTLWMADESGPWGPAFEWPVEVSLALSEAVKGAKDARAAADAVLPPIKKMKLLPGRLYHPEAMHGTDATYLITPQLAEKIKKESAANQVAMDKIRMDIMAWMEQQEAETRRFKFEKRVPREGEACWLKCGTGAIYFAQRVTENFYRSGSITIPRDDERQKAWTIVPCESTEPKKDPPPLMG